MCPHFEVYFSNVSDIDGTTITGFKSSRPLSVNEQLIKEGKNKILDIQGDKERKRQDEEKEMERQNCEAKIEKEQQKRYTKRVLSEVKWKIRALERQRDKKVKKTENGNRKIVK